MAWSCPLPGIRRKNIDTAMAQLVTNLLSGFLIEPSIYLVAPAAVDGRAMIGELLIAFARIGRAELIEAFEVLPMEDVSCEENHLLQKSAVAFVRCKHVTAAN